MWEAEVTEKKTFLEVYFHGGAVSGAAANTDDDVYCDEPCLRRYRSEPDLKKVLNALLSGPSSRTMFDKFSGCADKIRFDKNSLEDIGGRISSSKDLGSEISEHASTMEPLDESTSESSEIPWSPPTQALLSKSRGGASGVDGGVAVHAHHTSQMHAQKRSESPETWERSESPETWITKQKKMKVRPCKGQRERYRKTMTRLMMEIDRNPDFCLDNAQLPPSLLKDSSRKRHLELKLQEYQKRIQHEKKIDALLQPLIQRQYQIESSVTFDELISTGTFLYSPMS
jgi:hypothetical protein